MIQYGFYLPDLETLIKQRDRLYNLTRENK